MFGVLPRWVKCWLAISTLICSVDVAFTVLRPHSLRGGKYADYFFIWHIYADVDTRYGDPTDPITRVTGPLMCVELALNVIALFLDLFRSGHALVCALTSSALVFWKTSIYLCLYFGVWVFVPLVVIIQIWQIIARGWAPPIATDETDEDGNERGKGQNGSAAEHLHTLLTQRIMKNGKGNGELCALDEMDPNENGKNNNRRSRKQNVALIERLKIFTGRTAKDEK